MSEQSDTELGLLGLRILLGILLGALLGCIGGWFLAGPFNVLGAMMGTIFAAPVGLIIGAVCGLKGWPMRAVVIACLFQFAGAMALGHFLYDEREGPIGPACGGQIVGALLGLILLARFEKSAPKPGHCPHCGYNLTGLVEFRCPECGQPFDPSRQLPLTQDGAEGHQGNRPESMESEAERQAHHSEGDHG